MLDKKIFKIIKTKWQIIIALSSLFSIILHLIFKNINDQLAEIILYTIIIFGGIPLLLQIIIRLLKGNFGADLIAFIALILAIYLQDNFTAVLIISMLSSGQSLEEYASHRASFVLEALTSRMPSKVHLKSDNNFSDIDISQVKIGDLIAVFPHEICAIDGEIIQGYGTMDESYLTGEPYRISKTIGSKVLSGAINGDSLIIVKTEKLPKDSRYHKIMEIMLNAKEKKPKMRRIADKIGAVFAPIAITIAGLSYFFTGDLVNFLAVLTIATPCPLIIAVPVSIISAISISAKRGIIIKDPTALEILPTCSTAIFDKTGTLTYGEPTLTEIIALDKYSADEVLQKTASLERYSRHPLSSAILKEASNRNLILLDAENISEKPGYGMFGNISNKKIIITSRKKTASHQIGSIAIPEIEAGLECVVIIDNIVSGLLRFRDVPRKESKSFINHLGDNHNFKKIILLSGDRDSEVNYLAQALNIQECYSSKSPEQKLDFVKIETLRNKTLFMGDGINDAPALMTATVGIAFGQINNITSESAGIVILENNLLKVDELIHISTLMRKIAIQSAGGGMILSIIGMIFASFGMISPALGAIIQQIIDVLAIMNSLRLTFSKSINSDIKV
jgi:heavy metal translocating P-type ATPase